MKTKGYGHSVIGSREMNQDSYLANDELQLYAVADGIGGGLKGDVASRMAVDGLKAYTQSNVSMRKAFHLLQDAIYKDAIESFGEPLVGTTLTAVQIPKTGELTVPTLCHVGDSHLYHFDGTVLKLLTQDHESYDETFQGSVLNSYLGIDIKSYSLKIQEEPVTLKSGDKLLLCSDGLYKQIPEMRLVAVLKEQSKDPEEMLRNLCDEASKAEHSDNITIVYVEVTA